METVNRLKPIASALAFALIISLFLGCQATSQQDGIHVMFKKRPHVVNDQVFWRGQPIGTISDTQVGINEITKITLRLDSQFKQYAGHHWAFYVHRGRLMANKLAVSGIPVASGDYICGFISKASLNWFKVRTLLKDRVANAMRRAEDLNRRFG